MFLNACEFVYAIVKMRVSINSCKIFRFYIIKIHKQPIIKIFLQANLVIT